MHHAQRSGHPGQGCGDPRISVESISEVAGVVLSGDRDVKRLANGRSTLAKLYVKLLGGGKDQIKRAAGDVLVLIVYFKYRARDRWSN